MALFDDLVPLMPKLNAIAGALGANRFALTIRSETGASKNDFFAGNVDDVTTTDLPILESGQNPAFELRRTEAMALGVPEDAIVRFGPITPAHAGGGYTPDQLRGSGGHAVTYLVTGPGMNATRFQLLSLDTADPLAYYLTLKRV